MARPLTPAPAPNAIVGLLLRVNQFDVDDEPNLGASFRAVVEAQAAGKPDGDALEQLGADVVFLLERARATERRGRFRRKSGRLQARRIAR